MRKENHRHAHFQAAGLTECRPEADDRAQILLESVSLAASPEGVESVASRACTSPPRSASQSVGTGDRPLPRRALPPLTPAQRWIKRALDVAGALCLLLLAAPLMLLAALLIRLTSPGPALYTQTRVGRDGRLFTLFKLRTMVANAEARTGPVLATARDPRITAIGRLLRAAHIDELPQLLNVFLGRMSLIGPRPERPHFVNIYRRSLPGYERRLAVRPGITGLAQTSCPYSTAPARKLRFDLQYIENYSLALDAKIVLRTIRTVLGFRRAEAATVSAAPLEFEDAE
jgi:lipopolysaccharide/colanic/teichoic acid biosynthesis glycosyltransferase